MNVDDKLTAPVFAQGMALLAERWNREISPGMSRIYAEALKELGAGLFVVGITRAIEECDFFPSAATIRQLARPGAPASVEAGRVLAAVDALAVHSATSGRSWSTLTIAEQCGDAAARAFLAVGGSRRLAAVTDSDYPFLLRDFSAAFAAYSDERIEQDVVARRLEAVQRTGTIGGRPVDNGLTPLASGIAHEIAAILPRSRDS